MSKPDYEHSVLPHSKTAKVNTESECIEVVRAKGEMTAVFVNIMGMPRTDTEELARMHMSAACESNYVSVLLAPFLECLVFNIRVLYLHL